MAQIYEEISDVQVFSHHPIQHPCSHSSMPPNFTITRENATKCHTMRQIYKNASVVAGLPPGPVRQCICSMISIRHRCRSRPCYNRTYNHTCDNSGRTREREHHRRGEDCGRRTWRGGVKTSRYFPNNTASCRTWPSCSSAKTRPPGSTSATSTAPPPRPV